MNMSVEICFLHVYSRVLNMLYSSDRTYCLLLLDTIARSILFSHDTRPLFMNEEGGFHHEHQRDEAI